MTQEEQLLAWASLNRIQQGEPVQYVTGVADFYGLQLNVTPDVLIPRPETEELVEWILEENVAGKPLTVIDVGTGSGCIALALKHKRPEWTVGGLDASPGALEIAHGNAERLGIELERLINLDFLTAGLSQSHTSLDLIVSNPPYIPPSERNRMGASTLNHEPNLALFVPEENPLIFYRKLAAEALDSLVDGGKLYVETNEYNNQEVAQLFITAGLSHIERRKDMQGKWRMVRAVRSRP